MSQASKDLTNTEDELNFEQAFSELETLVSRMEKGQQSLEDSLGDFERGVNLIKQCHGMLYAAEQQVEQLVKNSDGLLELQPLDID